MVRKPVLHQIHDLRRRDLRILLPDEEEIRVSAVAQIGHESLIDPVCVGNDPAGLSLPEDLCQPYNRERTAFDQIPQHISGTNRWQLIHIPDQNQGHGIRYSFQ